MGAPTFNAANVPPMAPPPPMYEAPWFHPYGEPYFAAPLPHPGAPPTHHANEAPAVEVVPRDVSEESVRDNPQGNHVPSYHPKMPHARHEVVV